MAVDPKVLENIIGPDLGDFETACFVKENLSDYTIQDNKAFFEKYIKSPDKLFEMLCSENEKMIMLAIHDMVIYYPKDRYMAVRYLLFIIMREQKENQSCSIFYNEKNKTSKAMKMALDSLSLFKVPVVKEFLIDLCLKGEYDFHHQRRELAFPVLIRVLIEEYGCDKFLECDEFKSLLEMMITAPPFIRGNRIKDEDDPNGIIRRGLLNAFTNIKGIQITKAIEHVALKDPQEVLRGLACESLAYREEESATKTLIVLSKTEEFMSAQCKAFESLFLRRDGCAMKFFREDIFQKDEYYYPLSFVLNGLKDLDSEEFVRFLLRELQRYEERDRRERERFLICEILPKKYIALAGNESLQEEIIRVLWKAANKDPDGNVRACAISSFIEICGEEAVKKVLLDPL